MTSSWLNRASQILLLALLLLDSALAQSNQKQRARDQTSPQTPGVDKAAIEARHAKLKELLGSAEWLQGKAVGLGEQKTRKVRITADGFIRFLSLTESARFAAQGQGPEQAADAFVSRWRSLLVGDSTPSKLQYLRTVKRGPRSYVRYQQTFADLKVYGAEVMVKVNGNTDVVRVISGASTKTGVFVTGGVSLNPKLSASESQKKAVEWLGQFYPPQELTPSKTELLIFDPSVVGWKGPPQLVWSVEVTRKDKGPLDRYVFVNAQDGAIFFNYSRVFEALDRHVRNANNDPGTCEVKQMRRPVRQTYVLKEGFRFDRKTGHFTEGATGRTVTPQEALVLEKR